MKKHALAFILIFLMAAALSGCSRTLPAGKITAVSREDGSGTRSAFVGLFGIEQAGIDQTAETCEITNSTAVMLETIAGNPNAIGYVSMSALNDRVRALSIDGVEPSVQSVKLGAYPITRSFYIITGQFPSPAAADFIQFVLSREGQAIVEQAGYIPTGGDTTFAAQPTSGAVTITGSSSVFPVMEQLVEAYERIAPDTAIALQQSDSTSGIRSVLDGVCEIGMSSRALTEDELASGLSTTVLATDGIAVIVHPDNPLLHVRREDIMRIYTGVYTTWGQMKPDPPEQGGMP